MRALVEPFVSGLKLLCLRKPSLRAKQFALASLLFAIALILFAIVIADWLTLGAASATPVGVREFSWRAIVPWLLATAVLAWPAWMISRRLQGHAPDMFGQALLPLFIAYVVGQLFDAVVQYWIDQASVGQSFPGTLLSQIFGPTVPVFGAYWFLFASLVFVLRLVATVNTPPRNRWASWFVLMAWIPICLVTPLVNHYGKQSFWYAKLDDSPKPSLASEQVLNEQATLMRETLASFLPQRKQAIDAYFVAFAPFASQDVFLREVAVIHQLMDQRFDTKGRSAKLINHPSTVSVYPAATQTNLKQVLDKIGTVMDPDQDVVVLYLTSHGSKKHELSIEFWPMEFLPVNPPVIKKLLDDAGIKNRVLVVSACYSGGFIEPLKDDNTLILTASAKDKTSFGCSNESDFTYFGKALFDEQLRSTRSFEKAFDLALPIIKNREAKVTSIFSDPQKSVGVNIRERLKLWEQQFER